MENIKVTFRLKSERDSIYVWDRDFLLSFRVYDHRLSHLDCVMHYTHCQGAQKMRWFGYMLLLYVSESHRILEMDNMLFISCLVRIVP